MTVLQEVAQLTVNGLAVGSILALGAIGLTLSYGILRLSNFAHGDFMTLGAYLTLGATSLGLAFWPALLLGSTGTVGFFLLTEKLLWQPLRQRRFASTSLIIISIGLALFLRNGLILAWGADSWNYQLAVAPAVNLWGIRVTVNRLVVLGLALLAMVGLHLLLQKTRLGKAMRAVADNLDLARISGINVEQVILWTWVMIGGLTALGGGLYGLITAVRPLMGWYLLLPLFASMILGGIGNPYGAIAGAFTIGLAQELSTLIFPNEYKLLVALVIMIVMLICRPQGLFGDPPPGV
jgi:neutral amino acid transport system permease protein